MKKLDIHSTAGVVRYAIRQGPGSAMKLSAPVLSPGTCAFALNRSRCLVILVERPRRRPRRWERPGFPLRWFAGSSRLPRQSKTSYRYHTGGDGPRGGGLWLV